MRFIDNTSVRLRQLRSGVGALLPKALSELVTKNLEITQIRKSDRVGYP
jgi:hypothetical protein